MDETRFRMKYFQAILLFATMTAIAAAAEPAALTAKDLAAKLSNLQQDGSSYVRLKMDVTPAGGGEKFGLQLQIKQRRAPNSAKLVYQVLWPKERAGEAILLKQAGNKASGAVFSPPSSVKMFDASRMDGSLLGGALSSADVLDDLFAWDDQKIVGSEKINRGDCQVLESHPGKGQKSTVSGVRSWIDVRRLVPMRVEKCVFHGRRRQPDRHHTRGF
jgi:hypothetical protein